MSTGLRRLPLARAALAAVAGILTAESAGWRITVWAGLALLTLAAWMAPALKPLPRAPWVLALLACLFGALHQRRLEQTYHHPLAAHLQEAGAARAEVRARVLRAAPQPGRNTRLELLAESVRLSESGLVIDAPCRLRAFVAPALAAEAGDACVLSGVAQLLREAVNEGEFSARDFGLRSGVVAELRVSGLTALESVWWRSLPRRLQDAAEQCRVWIRERLARGMEERPDELAVIQAMTLGSSEDTDPRVEEPFRRSGTLHVFAVSGLHVVLICAILRFVLRPLGLRRPGLVAALVPLVFAYTFITGWLPSASRAAFMIALLLLGTLALRRASLLNNLGAAALLLLGWDTHVLFLPGFQLSFGVLLAIALLAGRFWEPLKPWVEPDPFLPPELASLRQRAVSWLGDAAAKLAGTSLAAWLGSLPLMWHHFHTVTPAGLLANSVLVPAAFICLSLSCSSLLAGLIPFFGGALQALLNQINGGLAAFMLWSAGGFSSLPLAHLHVPPPSAWGGRGDAELRVLALPYGSEAALLSTAGGAWMLDCGAENDFGRVLLPTLRRAGVNRLDGLFLSHADSAHIGGAEALLRTLPITAIHHPQHEPWRTDSRATRMRRLLEQTAGGFPGTRFQPLPAGQSVPLGEKPQPARLTALYPGPHDRRSLADDRGLVARLEIGPLRVLWVADAGFITETRLLEANENLRCDVLLRGAHAGDFHGTRAFLEAAAPRLILNAGPETPPGGKAPADVRAYAARHGVPLLFLAEHGGVTLRLDQATLRVETFQSQTRLDIPLSP